MECRVCGESGFSEIGRHWSSSRCKHQDLSEKQKEITVGLMLGDGSINRGEGNPRLQCKMITPNYLKYVDEQFGDIGCGVRKVMTASEQAEMNKKSGFDTAAKEKNYNDVYQFSTRRHPSFSEWSNWYNSGEKVWPEDIEITPTILKHWYCGDGHYHNNKSDSIKISTVNEMENGKKIKGFFGNLPVEPTINGKRISFTNEESDFLWNYMGNPLPDFEYKWPERYR